jgi:hypothetical protein
MAGSQMQKRWSFFWGSSQSVNAVRACRMVWLLMSWMSPTPNEGQSYLGVGQRQHGGNMHLSADISFSVCGTRLGGRSC